MTSKGPSLLADLGLSNLQVLWNKSISLKDKMEAVYPLTRKLSIFLMMLILLCAVPSVICLYILFAIYKLCIISCARMLRPDLDGPLPSPSAFLAQERSMVKSSKFNVLTMIALDGDLSLNQVRTAFQNRVLNKRNEKGESAYPELRQFWTRYMGYYFWKTERDFNLLEHVRLYDYSDVDAMGRVTEEALKGIIAEVLPQPWKDGHSPWELLMIPNYYDSEIKDRPQILLMFRIHHGMGDGHSIMKLTFNDLAEVSPVIPQSRRSQTTLQEKIMAVLTLPFRLLYDLAEIGYDSFEELTTLHFEAKEELPEYHVCFTSEKFQVDTIKAIKNKHGVSFNAVICNVLCGAIRRLLIDAAMDVPDRYSCGIAFPLPNRPQGELINHAILFFHKWPIGIESREVRLQSIFESTNKSKFYTAPIFSWLIVTLLNVTPNYMQWWINLNARSTIGASFFPGPENSFQYLGCKPTDIMFAIGMPLGKWGIFCTTLSISGRQRLVVVMDKKYFPSEEIFKRLDRYISEEMHAHMSSDSRAPTTTTSLRHSKKAD